MIVEPEGSTLQSFIDNALTPLVTALKDEPGCVDEKEEG